MDNSTLATEEFVMLMDKFFDAFNTRNMTEGKRKRKTMRDPYRTKDDWRFSVNNISTYKLFGHSIKIEPFFTVAQG